ncbi:uncharacterized protein LOC121050787 [Rosa chinensis]|uniref:uncharacterized protein LOC121050787 n=1 Tax=Rosa chinensis TaxID=74649 RepID=UPI001AD92233|nr:uncharacterized protein LOC121050787 [Rosa chinensis]
MTCAVGSKFAQELWSRLKLKFAAPDRQHILQLNSNLQNLKKGNDDIETYLDKIKAAKDALETVGVVVDDEDIVVTVLRGLPSEFAAIKTVIRTQSSCSLSQLKTLLKAAEVDIDSESQGLQGLLTAMLAKGNLNLSALTHLDSVTSHTSQSSSGSVPASPQSILSSSSSSVTPVASSTSIVASPQVYTQAVHYATSHQASPVQAYSQSHMASPVPAPLVPSGFSTPTQGLPTYPMSTQSPYIHISATPYGFTTPVILNPMAGLYAGRGCGRAGSSNAGRGNSYVGRGSFNPGGAFRNNFTANNTGTGGTSLTCQLCNKVGHGAKTCRSLLNFQQGNSSAQTGYQYYGRTSHTTDRCYFIIGFPGQQNDAEPDVPTAMMAASSLAPQFWLANTGATNHMTNNPHVLHNVTPYLNTDSV